MICHNQSANEDWARRLKMLWLPFKHSLYISQHPTDEYCRDRNTEHLLIWCQFWLTNQTTAADIQIFDVEFLWETNDKLIFRKQTKHIQMNLRVVSIHEYDLQLRSLKTFRISFGIGGHTEPICYPRILSVLVQAGEELARSLNHIKMTMNQIWVKGLHTRIEENVIISAALPLIMCSFLEWHNQFAIA